MNILSIFRLLKKPAAVAQLPAFGVSALAVAPLYVHRVRIPDVSSRTTAKSHAISAQNNDNKAKLALRNALRRRALDYVGKNEHVSVGELATHLYGESTNETLRMTARLLSSSVYVCRSKNFYSLTGAGRRLLDKYSEQDAVSHLLESIA